jgi:hypothetical protein
VGGELIDAERVLVGEQRQDLVDPVLTLAWPMRSWICLSKICSIGNGSAAPP